MVIFDCPNCGADIFFENDTCMNCRSVLGFDSKSLRFREAHKYGNNNYDSFGSAHLPYCQNHQLHICNWFVEKPGDPFCKACSLNRKVPNSRDTENFDKWRKLELAKHRLVYQLIKLGLPLTPKIEAQITGLAFDFLSQDNVEGLLTGHADGVITVLLSEADSVHREQLRKQMSEPYRTLLGHFRHEIGHYYWAMLTDNENLYNFRSLFGDETQNYRQALDNYYRYGVPNNWNYNYISQYAASHPWEDWAETWAHYLHLIDTLETAHSVGIVFTDDKNPNSIILNTCPNPYNTTDFKSIFEASVTLTSAANSLNRSMGLPDIYPFIVPTPVFNKLSFIHKVLGDYKAKNSFTNWPIQH